MAQPAKQTGINTETKRKQLAFFAQKPVEIRAELCKRSFYFFFQEFWDTICGEPLQLNWHLEGLCQELQAIGERIIKRLPKLHDLIINVPPGTSKSTLAVQMFPSWLWACDPTIRAIGGSYSHHLALEHAQLNRDIIRSDKYRKYFPSVELRRDKDQKGNFKNTRGGQRFTTSVGGTVTGMHGHVILVDDPINPKQAEATSEADLHAANDWIDRTLSTRKVDKAITPLILIMQRLHMKDPTAHLLDKAKEKGKSVKLICLPGTLDGSGTVEPAELSERYIDGLLDPVRLNRAVLEELQADLGVYGYAGQIDQAPVPKTGGTFQIDKLVIVPACPNVLQVVRYWDKAGSKNKNSAFTAGVKVARVKGGVVGVDYVILDVVRGKWQAAERERIIKMTAELDGHGCEVWVEQEPGSGGLESADSTLRNLAGFIAKKEVVRGDKVLRAEPLSAQVNIGNVGLLKADWNQEFIQELQHFPVGKFKDQVDAAGGGFNKVVVKRRVGAF